MSTHRDLRWGTSGINGTEPMQVKRLGDLTSDHLNNILACCGWNLSNKYKSAIYAILLERGVKPLMDITDEESYIIFEGYMAKREVYLREGIK